MSGEPGSTPAPGGKGEGAFQSGHWKAFAVSAGLKASLTLLRRPEILAWLHPRNSSHAHTLPLRYRLPITTSTSLPESSLTLTSSVEIYNRALIISASTTPFSASIVFPNLCFPLRVPGIYTAAARLRSSSTQRAQACPHPVSWSLTPSPLASLSKSNSKLSSVSPDLCSSFEEPLHR